MRKTHLEFAFFPLDIGKKTAWKLVQEKYWWENDNSKLAVVHWALLK